MNTYICIGQLPTLKHYKILPMHIRHSVQFHDGKIRVDIGPHPFYSNTHILHCEQEDVTALLLTVDNIRIIPGDIDTTVAHQRISNHTLITQLYNACIELRYNISQYPFPALKDAYNSIIRNSKCQQ